MLSQTWHIGLDSEGYRGAECFLLLLFRFRSLLDFRLLLGKMCWILGHIYCICLVANAIRGGGGNYWFSYGPYLTVYAMSLYKARVWNLLPEGCTQCIRWRDRTGTHMGARAPPLGSHNPIELWTTRARFAVVYDKWVGIGCWREGSPRAFLWGMEGVRINNASQDIQNQLSTHREAIYKA